MATGNRVAIVGVGYSTVGRNTGLSPEDLTIQATMAAFEDSGLNVHDIDGITSVGTEPLNDGWMLGIEPINWWASGMMVPAFAYSAVQAIAADRVGLLPHRARAPGDPAAAERRVDGSRHRRARQPDGRVLLRGARPAIVSSSRRSARATPRSGRGCSPSATWPSSARPRSSSATT